MIDAALLCNFLRPLSVRAVRAVRPIPAPSESLRLSQGSSARSDKDTDRRAGRAHLARRVARRPANGQRRTEVGKCAAPSTNLARDQFMSAGGERRAANGQRRADKQAERADEKLLRQPGPFSELVSALNGPRLLAARVSVGAPVLDSTRCPCPWLSL